MESRKGFRILQGQADHREELARSQDREVERGGIPPMVYAGQGVRGGMVGRSVLGGKNRYTG